MSIVLPQVSPVAFRVMLALLLCVARPAACCWAGSTARPQSIRVSVMADTIVTLNLGDTLAMRLPTRPGLGYRWFADTTGDSVAALRKLDWRTVRNPLARGMDGTDTLHVGFVAVRPGSQLMHFLYRRPFDPDSVPPRRRFDLKIVVKGAVLHGSANRRWPRWVGSGPVAEAALRMAESAYSSSAPDPTHMPILPDSLVRHVCLREVADPEVGEDSLWFDSADFSRIELTSSRTLYAQHDTGRDRLLLLEEGMNSPLAQYSLFRARSGLRDSDFERELRRGKSEMLWPIGKASWRAPIVFRGPEPGSTWIVGTSSHGPLTAWRLVVLDRTGARDAGMIEWRPPGDVRSMLPGDVRAFAGELDRTLEASKDEGTFQATARLRQDLALLWVNAALRPWAVGDSYRSRADADSDLVRWEHGSSRHRAAAGRIREGWTRAEQSLSRYYVTSFGLATAEADAEARFVLDVAYRSYFRHPQDEADELPRDSTPNPWPGGPGIH